MKRVFSLASIIYAFVHIYFLNNKCYVCEEAQFDLEGYEMNNISDIKAHYIISCVQSC